MGLRYGPVCTWEVHDERGAYRAIQQPDGETATVHLSRCLSVTGLDISLRKRVQMANGDDRFGINLRRS